MEWRCAGLKEVGVVDWSAELSAGAALLAQSSTADRVAEVLRTRIVEGLLAPGTRLSEEAIGAALMVSRNTLREAFRLLCKEHLAVHQMNRGVFVRVLSVDDVVDLYRLRRLIECAGVRAIGQCPPGTLDAVRVAVDDAERAVTSARWRDVGTADLHFHQALAGLVGSARVDELMRGVLAELRLVFHVMPRPQQFHQPYLVRNREILQLLEAGDGTAAEAALTSYLDDAERELISAYRERGIGSQAVDDEREHG
ncbi:GntR family transcriptional regulator [Actinacidiphila oryziradicis]|uniref:GntR family transcriptional regulator n=1 Tax=Actinacidiphila oryziradicis TaxID=2571141 RepID=A0A4U0S2C7_9ACTN|nr:GntR family transcriptional regulator [Actinacidiphila oryziradicis]